MAFMKYARATVVQPHVSREGWRKVRTAAVAEAGLRENLIDRAGGIFNVPFDPKQYLLTHATIVCSVDTYTPEGSKTGSLLDNGFRVNRRYADYRIKPECDKYINNNLDAWSRDVLLKSFETFIGGHNFVEHVQVEDLSKGRIIDAVARDIGESIYIDILIATDRKHTDLVKAIESGKTSTLSMGCTVDGTICTKCGHWAADETEMCPHVKYQKGNTFYDEQGRHHRIAELCGHSSLGPTGGVHFVEASWVGTPAFPGAVMRNILAPTVEITKRAEEVLNTPPPQWSAEAYSKAASRKAYSNMDAYLAGWGDDEGGGGDEGGGEGGGDAPAPKPEAPSDPLQKATDDLEQALLDRITKKIKERIDPPAPVTGPEVSTTTNESVVKEGAARKMYQASLGTLMRVASSDVEFLDGLAALNKAAGLDIPVPLYRVAVGAADRLDGGYDLIKFAGACREVLGRKPTPAEARTLMRIGKLLTSRSQVRQASKVPLAVAKGEVR